ncbi:hypothetical protein BDB00DRAFT_797320, partial [Zychaea mexicana]|uniref:uncharacterized protein n=1 Tax=Zychaea mexicana TaxID=64656 RepID=UPI0022FE9FBE
MQTLYTICLETVADHAEYITDWSNIPLDPFVLDIVRAIGEKESRNKSSVIYERIGAAHGARFPEHLGAVSLVGRDMLSLREATQLIPRFITHLNLSCVSGINDSAIILLKPCVNLRVLDLTRTEITDVGVSHLARM